jgi:hypothetical protein
MLSHNHSLWALLLLFSFSASAITRSQLTARYGRATWRQSSAGSTIVTTEQFVPETGVSLTARYDNRGNVLEIRIAPQGPESDEKGVRSVKVELSEKLLNQLLPRKQQPAESHSESTGACARITTAQDDQLTITREFHDCAPKGMNLTITWR